MWWFEIIPALFFLLEMSDAVYFLLVFPGNLKRNRSTSIVLDGDWPEAFDENNEPRLMTLADKMGLDSRAKIVFAGKTGYCFCHGTLISYILWIIK